MKSNLSENLVSLRKKSGLTQSALADACKIHQNEICRYESGSTVPSLATCLKLTKALKCQVSDLIKEVK